MIETKAGHKLLIIKQFCKSCEICVNFCPKDVLCLEPKTFKVTACNPDQCIGCKFCEWYCPDFAIFVEPAPKRKPPADTETRRHGDTEISASPRPRVSASSYQSATSADRMRVEASK